VWRLRSANCYIRVTINSIGNATPPHHNRLMALFPVLPDESVPEENFWTLWCKGRLTEADTPTIRPGATPSGLSSAHLHQRRKVKHYWDWGFPRLVYLEVIHWRCICVQQAVQYSSVNNCCRPIALQLLHPSYHFSLQPPQISHKFAPVKLKLTLITLPIPRCNMIGRSVAACSYCSGAIIYGAVLECFSC